jgi:hypothetical protein
VRVALDGELLDGGVKWVHPGRTTNQVDSLANSGHSGQEMNMSAIEMAPRERNLGQKEAEKEKAELDEEQSEDEVDELDPMKHDEEQ